MIQNSFARQSLLFCPNCRQFILYDLWQIIDINERPDLQEMILAGSLHKISCPTCNTFVAQTDSPMLLYRPNQNPEFIFSPAWNTSQEENQNQLKGLTNRLQKSLGEKWPVDWLEKLYEIPRPILPMFLQQGPEVTRTDWQEIQNRERERLSRDDPETFQRMQDEEREQAQLAPLLQTIREMAHASDWGQMRQVIEKHPEPLEVETLRVMENLVKTAREKQDRQNENIFSQRLALLHSCQEVGIQAAFEVINPSNSFPESEIGAIVLSFLNAGSWNKSKAILETHQAELTLPEALELFDRLMEKYRNNPQDVQELRAKKDLLVRCKEVGLERTLEEVSIQEGNHVPPELRQDLADALEARQRYMQGDSAALDQSIVAWQRLLQHPAFQNADPFFCLGVMNDAGTTFLSRYQAKEQISDLDKALELAQQAVKLTPDRSPNRAMVLYNLGNVLKARYALDLDLADLETAIQVYQQAVKLTPDGSPNQAKYLYSLGFGLNTRYERNGDLADLAEAIRVSRQAVELIPDRSTDRALHLNNLGIVLNARFARSEDLADLSEAIQLTRQAVELTPDNSADKVGYLNNLGNGLRDRYARNGDLADLSEAITAHQQAVKLTPDGSQNQAMYLNNLGNGLRSRYARNGDPADLDASIQAHQQAVEQIPEKAQNKAMYLYNLGNGLKDRYARNSDLADLAAGTTAYRSACQVGLEQSFEVTLMASRIWGAWAMKRAAWQEAAEAYEYGYQAVDRLFKIQLDRSAKESWLKEGRGLPQNYAYALTRLGRLEEAVTKLENGRTRLLGEALEQNRRDLERLKQHGEKGKQAYAAYQAALKKIKELQTQTEKSPTDWGDLNKEAHLALDEAVKLVQTIPGYETFLKPLKISQIASVEAVPIVYLLTTPQGGLALALWKNQIEPIALDIKEDDLDKYLVVRNGEEITGGYLPGALGTHQWLEDSLPPLLDWLGEKIMEPIAGWLSRQDIQQIALIPTGKLGLLPLHAAQMDREGKPTAFMGKFTVHYVPSAQALQLARKGQKKRSIRQSLLLGVGNPLPANPELDYARGELEAIEKYFPVCQTSYEYEASKADLLRHLPDAAYIHLSCHGFFNPMDPLDSRLLLANHDTLSLREVLSPEIHNQIKKVRLVVLSACQTALTDFNTLPDEVVGFPGGFLQAGAPGVIGTLWPVNDLSTALVMAKFYEIHIKEKIEPAGALRQAQLWLRDVTWKEIDSFLLHLGINSDEKPYESPYYWAPFVFVGV